MTAAWMPSYRPAVAVDGARATLEVRGVDGELVALEVDTVTARKLAAAILDALGGNR